MRLQRAQRRRPRRHQHLRRQPPAQPQRRSRHQLSHHRLSRRMKHQWSHRRQRQRRSRPRAQARRPRRRRRRSRARAPSPVQAQVIRATAILTRCFRCFCCWQPLLSVLQRWSRGALRRDGRLTTSPSFTAQCAERSETGEEPAQPGRDASGTRLATLRGVPWSYSVISINSTGPK